jgi:hypothetical protein
MADESYCQHLYGRLVRTSFVGGTAIIQRDNQRSWPRRETLGIKHIANVLDKFSSQT